MKKTRSKAILVKDQGDLVCRYAQVYRPGTPAGPDPDRAEMLLAEGIANYRQPSRLRWPEDQVAEAFGVDNDGCPPSSPWAGAYDVIVGQWRMEVDDMDSDLYLAGAALAMALESP